LVHIVVYGLYDNWSNTQQDYTKVEGRLVLPINVKLDKINTQTKHIITVTLIKLALADIINYDIW